MSLVNYLNNFDLNLSLDFQKLITMKIVSRKVVLRYLYDQLTGNFAGFLIGMSATTLVSQFFETRGLRNLWGLTSKKTVVDKDTFSNLEWIISIVIGFVVFELMTKVVKRKIDKYFPKYKYRFLRWMVAHGWHTKIRNSRIRLNQRRIVIVAAMHTTLKRTFGK
jgi:hypothetical protein